MSQGPPPNDGSGSEPDSGHQGSTGGDADPGGGAGAGDRPPPPPGSAPPPAPQAPGVASRDGQPADLGPRFLARLIDGILLAIVYSVIVVPVFIGSVLGMGGGFGFGVGATFGATAVGAILNAAITLGYFTFMESSRGQTVGKMLLKLEVRGPAGGTPTTEEALRRNAWTALGIIAVIPFIGWLLAGPAQLAAAIYIAVTINNAATKQGWHDTFAGGTQVLHRG